MIKREGNIVAYELTFSPTRVSSQYYLKKALHMKYQNEIPEMIQYLDCAVILSSRSCFYIYQKIKVLFDANQFHLCDHYIQEQLLFLYQHASLYITCRVIDFYQNIHDLTSDSLKQFLVQKSIPVCLSDIYVDLLSGQKINFLHLANKAFIQDNLSLCIHYCDFVLKKNRACFEALYLKANAYHLLKNLYIACQYYEKCILLNDKLAYLYRDYGFALMELGLIHKALSLLHQAYDLEPNNVDNIISISECYCILHKYQLAQKLLEKNLKIHPQCLQIYFHLSYICNKQNKKFLAKKYLRLVRKLKRPIKH